jgi:hypothetical protein
MLIQVWPESIFARLRAIHHRERRACRGKKEKFTTENTESTGGEKRFIGGTTASDTPQTPLGMSKKSFARA